MNGTTKIKWVSKEENFICRNFILNFNKIKFIFIFFKLILMTALDVNILPQNELEEMSSQGYSLVPMKFYSGYNLKKMLYLKQLEDAYKLSDFYDFEEAIKAEEGIVNLGKYNSVRRFYFCLISFGVVCGYLFYRKVPLFEFNSYINHIYSVPFIFSLTYTFLKFRGSLQDMRNLSKVKDDLTIFNTTALMHTHSVSITNELKFNASETY